MVKQNIYILMFFIMNIVAAEKSIFYLQPSKNCNYGLTDSFLRSLASLSGADNFVETGTYYGLSTAVAAEIFKNIYSVELSPLWHEETKKRLSHYSNIKFYLGDSKQVLPSIINELQGKTIFYLDGHYSGGTTAKGDTDTPIIEELLVIKNSNLDKPIILIDDARCFTRQVASDYPSLADIEKIIKDMDAGYNLYVVGDMALALHSDEPFIVSPVIQACTMSRMAIEYDIEHTLTDQELNAAENSIAHAQGQEKEALLELIKLFKGTYHYSLWAGLIELNMKHYDQAAELFKTVTTYPFYHSNVKYYLKEIRRIQHPETRYAASSPLEINDAN